MNYARIYSEFISDRLLKQPKDGRYFEIHHILPRCMGGGDEPGNLIRLTASDHLFAHQLLARAYAKTKYAANLWGAVLVLCRDALRGERVGNGGKRLGSLAIAGVKGLRLRKSLDTARARRVGEFSGDSHPNADKHEYAFKNVDGREFVGTRISFCDKYGVTPGSIPRLLEDEWCRTKNGWYIVDENKTDEDRAREADPVKYVFLNENGAVYKGTRLTFKRYTGKDWDAVHAIIDGIKDDGGWALGDARLKTRQGFIEYNQIM